MGSKLGKVIVIKIGGATLGSQDTTVEDIVSLQRQGKSLVIVHGGGKIITDWLTEHGVSSKFVQGERVTDKVTLDAVISVLTGPVNKEIVAGINSLGGKAVGINSVDKDLIQARIKNTELGYVGVVEKVNLAPLKALLQSGYIPVVAPLGFYYSDQPGETRGIVNINADVVAGEVAAAISAERLIFLTDVVGVCDQSGNLLPNLSPSEAEALLASGVASGGMIPKIKACLRALSGTLVTRIIDGREPHALLDEIKGKAGGTTIGRGK
jgi:acetylglutamate kinase